MGASFHALFIRVFGGRNQFTTELVAYLIRLIYFDKNKVNVYVIRIIYKI